MHDEELTARCETMSKESSKKNSKKDRKTQRLVFRDVYATLAVRCVANSHMLIQGSCTLTSCCDSAVIEWRIAAYDICCKERSSRRVRMGVDPAI